MQNNSNINLAIIGLGYVGLPLAIEFAKYRKVIGFDISKNRISELQQNKDNTLEISENDLLNLQNQQQIIFTNDVLDLQKYNINTFIITVPTPIDDYKRPDLQPLLSASEIVGKILKKNDIVIYESTVYPGATEEQCVPVLEHYSQLKFNVDFFVAYSPERINPGDKIHRVSSIKKITSGSNKQTAEIVDNLYNEIITVGTHKAESIKVAEAAKVIENTQRDVNIALINELAILFNKLNLDTEAVLNAAGSKWNFLPFRPGLVGGHCIGVDPYYLTHKAQAIGYHPEIILAGRRLNDNMGFYIANKLVKKMTEKDIRIKGADILIMGFSFKENCPDYRNTKVIDIIKELNEYHCKVSVFDTWIDYNKARQEYSNITPFEFVSKQQIETNKFDAIILAVAHNEFKNFGISYIKNLCKENNIIYDIKYLFSAEETDMRL